MWVIATVFVCTAYTGCMTFVRSPDKADIWLIAPTEEACVEGNLRTLQETVDEMGDVLHVAHITCEKMGA